jgi:hypothetical protein
MSFGEVQNALPQDTMGYTVADALFSARRASPPRSSRTTFRAGSPEL